MMGAMPAVAVRLERRKAEQRLKRPSQLYLGGYPHLRQQTTSPSKGNSPSPSPLLSPPRFEEDQRLPEVYVCGKVSALHLAVVSLLLGAVILIVGLVQLKPGADAPGHRYYLIGVGCFLEVLGLIITATRCVMLHLKLKRKRSSICSNSKKCEKVFQQASSSQIEGTARDRKTERSWESLALLKEVSPGKVLKGEAQRRSNETGYLEGKNSDVLINGTSPSLQVMDSQSPNDAEIPRSLNLKQLYNSSDVMYIDEMSDAGERKSKSPVESVNTIDIVMGGGGGGEPPGTCTPAKASPVDLENVTVLPAENRT